METEAAQAAGDTGAPEILATETPREWTPPKKEFSAFVEALESELHAGSEARDGSATEATEASAPEPLDERISTAPRAVKDTPGTTIEPPLTALKPSLTADEKPLAADNAPLAANNVPLAAGEVSLAADDVPRVSAGAGEASIVAAESGAVAEDGRGRVARVREGTRARVGKMREDALVVLEETPDDSGLRFVVAAAALFLVFLFILFLSTTVLR
jgi:hypothetical protein